MAVVWLWTGDGCVEEIMFSSAHTIGQGRLCFATPDSHTKHDFQLKQILETFGKLVMIDSQDNQTDWLLYVKMTLRNTL